MQSERASHRAVRAALGERFFSDWCRRAPYSAFHPQFLDEVERCAGWPSPADYDRLAQQVPQLFDSAAELEPAPLPHFVAQQREALRLAGGYEQYVARRRAVPTREQSWHDFFNMAVWAHFPRTRWALNALHVDADLGPVDSRNGRTPEQNVAAQFDESGIVVASSSAELLADLRELRFKRVFWERRAELLATTRFWIIGHGTLESLLAPHLGLASKGVLLQLERAPTPESDERLRCALDQRLAAVVRGWRGGAPALDPVPLLGIPGYADNAFAEFYDNARYFRFRRR
ncbi:MAG TPA: DUF3025 domain-containing protein [Polyangiaceae bacterium]